jgi:hypothetical protein
VFEFWFNIVVVWLLRKCEKESENLAILLTFRWLTVCCGEYHVVITLKMKIQSHIVCIMPKLAFYNWLLNVFFHVYCMESMDKWMCSRILAEDY